MDVACVCEHNGGDTLLYAANLPGAYTRGHNREAAIEKMEGEVRAYMRWAGESCPETVTVKIMQNAPSALDIRDADSDVLFDTERQPLTDAQYRFLKALALKSAADFLALYNGIPDKKLRLTPARSTFYGCVPGTAEEMYQHTKSVNSYYFAEIGVDADNVGTILECRQRGFAALEQQPDFLRNAVIEGSYGEMWSLRKVLRRFIWHDRIHAKAMYRRTAALYGADAVPNLFFFEK